MWVCPSSPLSTRRYEYIEYENGKVLGDKKQCSLGTTKVSQRKCGRFFFVDYFGLFIVGRLMVAISLLALQLLLLRMRWTRQEIRSLLQLETDFVEYHQQHVSSSIMICTLIKLNVMQSCRVVTGIRFYKQNRIIHLQIQEGQLLERGRINSTTTRWVPVEDYTIQDKGIRDGRDYHTLAWDRREVDLDDLTAPVGHVVVSSSWRKIYGEKLKRDNLIFTDWCEVSRCWTPFKSGNASVGDKL